ncbi:MAG: hypothetical protein ACOYN5_13320 [Bacteroidales bacterium]
MKEQEKMDSWLRSGLENYQPETNQPAKERFLMDAASLSGKGNKKSFWLIPALLAIATFTATIFIVWPTDEQATQIIENTDKQITTSVNTSKSKENTQSGSANLQASIPITQTTEKITNESIQLPKGIETSAEIQQNNSISEIQTSLTEPSIILQDSETISEAPAQEKSDNVNIAEASEVQKSAVKEKDELPIRKKSLQSDHDRTISLYYRPEMIWNIIENEKLVHNFGLEWQYKLFNNRYVLGTGLGVSLSEGYYEYAIDYNEYLGSYEKLDSISFVWDQENFSMSRTLYTSPEEVFDSVIRTDYERVYRKFVYLQIPLLMGYDFIQKENYSVGIRFAPILSVLLTKNTIDFQYDAGLNQIVQINRITPERVQTNWQLTTGINLTRSLGKYVIFEVEPRFTYYFNSVYEKSEGTSPPLSAGIRVAFGIKY